MRILITDDDPCCLVFTQGVLTKAGHHTEAITSPVEAIRLVEEAQETPNPFNVVIADYYLQHLTGMQLLEKIRLAAPEIPVVVTSCYDCIHIGRLGRQQSQLRFVHLPKPFDSKELLTSIDVAVEKVQQQL